MKGIFLQPIRLFLLTASVALAVSLGTARASITTYTDRAAFMASLGGAPTTLEPFNTAMTFVLGNNFYDGINFRVTGTSVGGNGISGGILNGDEFTSSSID